MSPESGNPLVSVGIPTFNRSESLKRCVAFILAQSVQDFEIIIADNGSADDTWSGCRALAAADARIRVFRQSPPVNSTENFDFVRQQARGEYVLLLGDDDWIDRDYLERCTAELSAKPDHIAVGGWPQYYRDGAPLFRGVALRADDDRPARRLLQALSQIIDAGTFHAVFRRSLSGPIPLKNAFGMDYLYVCEAAFRGKIATLHDTTVHRVDNSHLKPIADSVRGLGLPPEQGRDHYGTIVALIFWHIVSLGRSFAGMPFWPRLTLAAQAAEIVFRRWHVRDEQVLFDVAQSIFPDADISMLIRDIRTRLVLDALPRLGDASSSLWNRVLPAILPTLARLAFRQVSPVASERDLLLRLRAALQWCDDPARKPCGLSMVNLFY